MPKLTPEQQAVADELKAVTEKARLVKLDIAIIIADSEGFFIMGSCCGPCANAMIHTAADYLSDPRDPAPVEEISVIVIQ